MARIKTLGTAIAIAGSLALTLSACGNDPGHRALTGGGIGAGAGALGAAVLGANPVTGALIGGAVGAVTGAATSSDQIDLNSQRERDRQYERDRERERDEARQREEDRKNRRRPRGRSSQWRASRRTAGGVCAATGNIRRAAE